MTQDFSLHLFKSLYLLCENDSVIQILPKIVSLQVRYEVAKSSAP